MFTVDVKQQCNNNNKYSNSFSNCKGDQKKTVAISQMFNHVQLHVHWVHLLNIRICRYTSIYITPTVNTTLLPCRRMPLKRRHTNVYVTSWRRVDISPKSFWRHVRAGWDQDRYVKSCSTLKMKSTAFLTKFGHKLLLFYLLRLIMCEEFEKVIARTLCFMHLRFFGPTYIFNNDAHFLDFRAQKYPLIFFNVNPF